jgi:hypothetical protein
MTQEGATSVVGLPSGQSAAPGVEISVVVPILNERENIRPILTRICYESRGKPVYDVKSRRNLPGYG